MVLPLPVADSARLAWPDLDPRIERLRVQGIAVSSREFRASCAARLLRMHVRNPGSGNHDPFGLDEFGLGRGFRARGGVLGSTIRLCLNLNRLELGRRPERLRRKQCLGKVETEELVGTILIRDRRTARCSEPPTDGFLSGSDRQHCRSLTAFWQPPPEPLSPVWLQREHPISLSSLEGLHGRGRPRLGRRRYRRLNGQRRRACRERRSIFDDPRVCGSRCRCAGLHSRLAVAPAGSSQSPGTSNGWSSRISNQCARNRPYRAEHHGAR
jgi:hypothetical protein